MPTVKFSSKIDEAVWNELKQMASESHQNISGLLTHAVSEYISRRRIRPTIMHHLKDSMSENETLGKLLAK